MSRFRGYRPATAAAARLALSWMVGGIVPAVAADHDTNEHMDPEHHLRNRGAVMLGATTNTETNHTGFTLATDYERKLSAHWGVGLVLDVVAGGVSREAIVGPAVFYHILEPWWVVVAPGVEFFLVQGATAEEDETETEFVMRIGTAYDFPFHAITIGPELNVDFTQDAVSIVYGIAFGNEF